MSRTGVRRGVGAVLAAALMAAAGIGTSKAASPSPVPSLRQVLPQLRTAPGEALRTSGVESQFLRELKRASVSRRKGWTYTKRKPPWTNASYRRMALKKRRIKASR